jgi:GcrA cell cycle regulator
MGWTDERVERLKKLWADGLSGAQIAKELGGTTRNGVIGKVHRLGLADRLAPSSPGKPPAKAAPRQPRSIPSPRTAAPKLKVIHGAVFEEAEPRPAREQVAKVEEGPGLATLLTLESRMCKWPIGDPSTDAFTFCGRRKEEGSYCVEHARIAFQPHKGGKERAQRELTRSLRRYS